MTKCITRFQLTGDSATVEELLKCIPNQERDERYYRNHILYEEVEYNSERHKELSYSVIGKIIDFYGKALSIEDVLNASPCIPDNQQLNTLYEFCVFKVKLT